MSGTDSTQQPGVFSLSPTAPQPPPGAAADAGARDDGGSLPGPLLAENAVWFCRLRWGIVGILLLYGLAGIAPGLLERAGLVEGELWPFFIAAVLAGYNLVFLAHGRAMLAGPTRIGPAADLWGQILLDLLVLTAVVHFVGSTETYIPFAYLMHVVLSCIFFSRTESLLVVLLACTLFVGCVLAEQYGLLAARTIVLHAPPRATMTSNPGWVVVETLSAVAVFLAVWYLASHLSAMVRARDRELAATNVRLLAAQKERAEHMLRTTHELKAPFAAIQANTQLLMKGYCGPLGDEAMEVVRRIAARCRRLTREIQEMLQLANLRSEGQEPPAPVRLDLAELMEWCLVQVAPTAQERGVRIESELRSARIIGVEDHLKMLFGNLLSNAISYSRRGGRVRVWCGPDPAGGLAAGVADEGIGIPPEKLPRIFEEYYRTSEAVRHNQQSSGLGLAIVRKIVEMHGLGLVVTSRPGEGSTFEVKFPGSFLAEGGPADEENHDGVPDDRRR